MKKYNQIAAVILAAGKGKRMNSTKPKVLHEILGVPMISYVIGTVQKIVGDNIVIVIGNQAEKVRSFVSTRFKASYSLQQQQLGTGHAVRCALADIPDHIEHVMVLCGDVPLIQSQTIQKLADDHLDFGRDISLIAANTEKPYGYGRVLMDDQDTVRSIVEESDADEEQKKITTINTGTYIFNKHFLREAIGKIGFENRQSEMYLTDIIGIGNLEKKKIGAVVADKFDEFLGVNTPEDLKRVETLLINRSKIS